MVLKGALCLVADLIRAIEVPCDIEVVQCASYGEKGTSRGSLQIFGLEQLNLYDRDVLIVDDIFDSGNTLASLTSALQKKKVRSLKSFVLLCKNVKRDIFSSSRSRPLSYRKLFCRRFWP